MTGHVSLVGAGPGDPDLVTDAALAELADADVVVFDRLAAPQLLAAAPETAERIDAGKKRADHRLTQDEINALIVDRARDGQRVVRLKGGDPFLYGRGGEEAIALREAGIPFTIVPGITSALSVPAYAGIPVTHRGVAESVTIITGHRRETSDPDEARRLRDELDEQFRWLAAGVGTIVVLMGRARLREISRDLIRHGKSGATPAALISRGTTPAQRTLVAPLRDIGDAADQAQIAAPAILVIGEVVRLREQLQWFEDRPLFGQTIVVTRARPQASMFAAQLRSLGAEVIEAPTLAIEPLADAETGLSRRIDQLAPGWFLAFTSDAAVEVFFTQLAAMELDARRLSGVRVAVVGGTTAAACRRFGIEPDIVPPHGKRTGAGLAERMAEEALYGAHVLFPCAEGRHGSLEAGLTALGGVVEAVPVYRTRIAELSEDVRAWIRRADLITVASGSSVDNLVAAFADPAGLPPAISIGPTTTAAAHTAGLTVAREADEPSLESLIVAVLQHTGSAPESTPAAAER